jgi:ribosomal peptide maturation radical SAM protein 1
LNSEIPPTRKTLNSPRVALVCMPWGSVLKPPVGLAILKRSAEMAGFIPQVHFLNMKFAERLGLETYERISEEGFLWAEWFFSQAVFGPNGSGQLKNDWSSIEGDPDASDLVQALGKVTDDPGGLSSRIASEYIPAFLDECLKEIAWSVYSVVGFTTTFAQSLSSLLLARLIKERWPELKVIFGGANVDSEMGVEYLRNFPWVDYVAHGEAENTFPALLNNIAAGCPDRRISGISMRCDGEVIVGCQESRPLVNMNDSPLPDYSDYLHELEKRKWKKPNFRLYFESSRGCWWGAKHHCTFCGLNGSTMAFRRKNSDRVRQEIRQLAQDYRCLNFAATDNILPMDYVEHLMPQLEDMDLDFDLFYEVKANLGRKHLRALAGAGVQSIQPGIESFNTAVLDLMRKGVTAIQNVQLLKWCREYNIEPLYNIIFGCPGESEESYRDTPQLMRALSHLRPPRSIHELMFQRFSPYDFDRDALKIRLTPLPIYRYIFPQDGASLERMAYYFKGDWEGRNQDLSYIQPVIDAWRAWEKRWSAQDTFCYYEKGPAFLSIYDNRPLSADGPARCRRIVLSEHASALYLFCDENRSLGSILSMMAEKFAGAALDQNVMLWLDQLVRQGLIMREGDRYLSLAVRKAGKSRKAAKNA